VRDLSFVLHLLDLVEFDLPLLDDFPEPSRLISVKSSPAFLASSSCCRASLPISRAAACAFAILIAFTWPSISAVTRA
jgi:hypothetical protein